MYKQLWNFDGTIADEVIAFKQWEEAFSYVRENISGELLVNEMLDFNDVKNGLKDFLLEDPERFESFKSSFKKVVDDCIDYFFHRSFIWVDDEEKEG